MQNKKIKIDYSPLSNKAKKRVKEIADTYGFKKDFDLAKELNCIPTNLLSLNNAIKSVPRPAETKRQIYKLHLSIQCFLNAWKKINKNTRLFLNEILIKYVKRGCKNMTFNESHWSILDYEETSEIFNNIYSYLGVNNGIEINLKDKEKILKLHKQYQKFLNILNNTNINTKLFLNKIAERNFENISAIKSDWLISDYEKYSEILNKICRFALSRIKKDKGGSKSLSTPRNLILFLASIYHNGTNKKPTCGWYDIDGYYIGEFYDFLQDITPLLKEEFRLDINKIKEVTGKYAVQVLKTYRKNFI